MNDISMLEELGLQEVSRKTHIEAKTLQWMLEKKFEKLNRINTLGFVKILSREYQLNLNEWVEEFEAYLAENQQETPTVERVYISSSYRDSKRRWPWVLILLLAGGIGAGWYFDALKYVDQIIDNGSEQNISHLYKTTPVVEEAKENLATLTLEEESNETVREEEPVIMVAENSHVENPVMDVSNEDGNNTDIAEITAEEAEKLPTTEVAKTEGTVMETLYSIKPGQKIWVGVIYLDNMRRASYLTEEMIVFDHQREQIITTGHGKFDLIKGEEQESFNSELPKRYHIKDSQIMPISYEEFITLNKGKPW